MLNGLEAVEINFKNLERTFRIDSEFYKKEYLQIEKILKNIENQPLTNIVNVSDGNHMSISNDFVEKGFPYYRGQDVASFFIEQANPICITNKAFNKPLMKRSHLQQHDILLSIVGTIGKLSLVKEDNKATCNCKLAILRPKIKGAEYLSIILQSKYGQSQIERLTRGAVQKGLILEDMDQLLIPDFEETFKNLINLQIEKAYEKLEESKALYKQAQNLLLRELGLLGFTSLNQEKDSKTGVSIKAFNKSFGISGRLDSEYYQPKFDEIIKHIQKKPYDTLGDIVHVMKSIEPGSDAYQEDGIPFVRVSNLSKFEIVQPEIYISPDLLDEEELELLQPQKNTILFSKDGTVGIAYNVKEDSKFITSGALLHLTIKKDYIQKVLPEYLTLLLNSSVVQLQSERDAGGSIIKHWKPSEIKEVLVPVIDYGIQTRIEEKVQESFRLKEQSKQLLEIAKKAVEIAIEQNEDAALSFIDTKGIL